MAFGTNHKNELAYSIDNYPVPPEWIFEKLLNLSEKLEGQSVSIHSVFNPNDSDPSMIIYFCDKADRYKFKCFSTGNRGEAVELIQLLYNLEKRHEAYSKGLELYESDDTEMFHKRTITPTFKEVTNWKIRKWNTNDQKYWSDYHIGSKQLEYYNIYPLSFYEITVKQGTLEKRMIFENDLSYGYFTKKGKLMKIYNPKNSVGKFVKVSDYIQGYDQLRFKNKWLIISSSMKDILALRLLGFPIDLVASHSENTMFNKKTMNFFFSKYKYVSILFDDDLPGINSAIKYKEAYGTPYTKFDIEKDVARCVKEHGIKNSKIFLKPKLIKTLNEELR